MPYKDKEQGKAHHKAYYLAHRDERVEKQRLYNRENRAVISERNKKRYHSNIGESRKRLREYYHANIDKKREWCRQDRIKNGDILRQKAREDYHKNRVRICQQVRVNRINNGDVVRQKANEYHHKNRERINQQAREYRLVNGEHIRAKVKKNYHKNIDIKRVQSRASYQRHKDKRRVGQRKYYYEHIEEIKKYQHDYNIKNRDKNIAYRENNADRLKDSHRRWCMNNPEVRAASKRKGHHKRRTVENESFVKWSLMMEYKIRVVYDDKCSYCGGMERLQFDHIIPLLPKSKDTPVGTHSELNMAMACQKCNQSKHNKYLQEWFWTAYCLKRGISESTINPKVWDRLMEHTQQEVLV